MYNLPPRSHGNPSANDPETVLGTQFGLYMHLVQLFSQPERMSVRDDMKRRALRDLSL